MIRPVKGMAFIIEDQRDSLEAGSSLKEAGFIVSDERLAGVTGVIYAINDESKCPKCRATESLGLKAGDRVIFSRFTAEQLDVDIPDVPKGRLRAVPTESILGCL